MSEANHPDVEALLRAEVDRAVAPYVGKSPPVVLRKLRQIAERYYREHPQASRILRLQAQAKQARSGTEAIAPGEAADEAAGQRKV